MAAPPRPRSTRERPAKKPLSEKAIVDAALAITKAEIGQNEKVYEYLKDKFTSADLYQWLVGRISSVYFQAYRLALEQSQSAQRQVQRLRQEQQAAADGAGK